VANSCKINVLKLVSGHQVRVRGKEGIHFPKIYMFLKLIIINLFSLPIFSFIALPKGSLLPGNKNYSAKIKTIPQS
jgi:hypothetical protein